MNSDEIKSVSGQLITAAMAIMLGFGLVSSDQAQSLVSALTAVVSSVSTLVPAILMIVSISASIWHHWNMRKVPENAVVLPNGVSEILKTEGK